MVKESNLERDGEILEVLPAGKFKIKLKDTDLIIICYKSGKMKQSHISVIQGDWVKVEVNQYDMTQGRIVYRYNDYKNNK
ncbi:translation initiation factor IF-1 [Candidatus Gracilibacteria bacterium]|nr:translation initiation factor IF-1 [Candidatus Gracilibacteria bacterium]